MTDDKLFENIAGEILDSFRIEVEKLTERIALILERETKDVLSKNDKIATADLYKSIRSKVVKFAWGYIIRVFSGVNYAQFVYDGTKPHFPPINKIAKWIRIKGLAGRYSVKTKRRLGGKQEKFDEDTALAWAIAIKISRKGTKAFKFFDLALKQGLPIIEKEVLRLNNA